MSAVEEYRKWDAATITGPQANLIKAQADAAIAELDAKVEHWKGHYEDCLAENAKLVTACRQADAENERLRNLDFAARVIGLES